MPPDEARVVSRLTPVPSAVRTTLGDGPADAATHAAAMAAMPALHEIELGGSSPRTAAAGRLRVAAWNVGRLPDPDSAAGLLATTGADVTLLGEIDLGMARTGNRHGIAELARRLGHGYAFGVEFVELGPGHDGERAALAAGDRPATNDAGLHGNGIVSALTLHRPFLVRLDREGGWFATERGERRVGGRMALGAQVELDGRAVTLVSVHLESHSDPHDLAAQMQRLLDAVDRYDPDAPVILGGDLNTSTRSHAERLALRRGPPPDPVEERRRRLAVEPYEPLFARLAARGYDWRSANRAETPTQRVTRPGKVPGRIDWIAVRGLAARDPAVVPALAADGATLSDHECLTVEFSM